MNHSHQQRPQTIHQAELATLEPVLQVLDEVVLSVGYSKNETDALQQLQKAIDDGILNGYVGNALLSIITLSPFDSVKELAKRQLESLPFTDKDRALFREKIRDLLT
jgi:hypothetical protein